jgi:hypothetical protein
VRVRGPRSTGVFVEAPGPPQVTEDSTIRTRSSTESSIPDICNWKLTPGIARSGLPSASKTACAPVQITVNTPAVVPKCAASVQSVRLPEHQHTAYRAARKIRNSCHVTDRPVSFAMPGTLGSSSKGPSNCEELLMPEPQVVTSVPVGPPSRPKIRIRPVSLSPCPTTVNEKLRLTLGSGASVK